MKKLWVAFALLFIFNASHSQDTFSIVAVDTVTGEVGAAGASCVDLFAAGFTNIGFIAELFPGIGAIASQASYISSNQVNARNRMNAGDTPAQIISWLIANDVGNNPSIRQYGIAKIIGSGAETAAHTGTNCQNYKNHILGPNYSIQGNILLGQHVLDSMESRFNAEQGDLACKLMAALQGANIPGADSRCLPDGTSSLFAFVKVAQPTDAFLLPSLNLGVRTHDNTGIEPIDSLQVVFNQTQNCSLTGILIHDLDQSQPNVFPNPANSVLNVVVPSGTSAIKYSIRNSLGQIILQGESDDSFQIVTEKFSAGFYMLELSTKLNKTFHQFHKL